MRKKTSSEPAQGAQNGEGRDNILRLKFFFYKKGNKADRMLANKLRAQRMREHITKQCAAEGLEIISELSKGNIISSYNSIGIFIPEDWRNQIL